MEFDVFKSMVDVVKTERPKLFQPRHDNIPGTEEIFEYLVEIGLNIH